jgi:hypothetical protein
MPSTEEQWHVQVWSSQLTSVSERNVPQVECSRGLFLWRQVLDGFCTSSTILRIASNSSTPLCVSRKRCTKPRTLHKNQTGQNKQPTYSIGHFAVTLSLIVGITSPELCAASYTARIPCSRVSCFIKSRGQSLRTLQYSAHLTVADPRVPPGVSHQHPPQQLLALFRIQPGVARKCSMYVLQAKVSSVSLSFDFKPRFRT